MMLKSLRNFLLISSLMGLWLIACSAGSTSTDTPTALTATASVMRPAQAATVAATATSGQTPTLARPTQTPRPPTASPTAVATATAPAAARATEPPPGTQAPTPPAQATPATLAVCPSPGEGPSRPFEVREGQSVVENLEPQILDYLNAGGDVQALQTALEDLTLPDEGSGWQSRTQVFSADVTGDDVPEVVLDLSFFVEGQYAEGALFVYRCQAGAYAGGAVAHIGGQVFSGDDPDPGMRAIQDMNGDDVPEIVFSYITVIGTHANFGREFRVIAWDGDKFVDLIQGDGDRPHAAGVLNGDGVIRDNDGDGILELELTHGVGHGPETSALERSHTDVWAWDGQAFTLAYTQAAPPVFRIQAAWDGDAATLRGDYDGALAFYQQAIFDEALLGWAGGDAYDATAADPDERPRLSAYSRYRIMLLHVARGYLPEAQIVYDTLQEKFPQGAVGHAYAALATVFWDGYSANQDVAAACGQAVEYAAAHADAVLDPLGSAFYGLGWPDYAPHGVCPLR
jgi:hypothetical protein